MPLNASLVRDAIARMREAADDISSNVRYVLQELPKVNLPANLDASVVRLCADLQEVLHDIATEFDNLEDKLGLRPAVEPHDPDIVDPNPRGTMQLIGAWLREETLPIDAVVRDLRNASEGEPKLVSACVLVSESAANMLTAYSAIAEALREIDLELTPSSSPGEQEHVILGSNRRSVLDPGLIRAFNETSYEIRWNEQAVALRIGQHSDAAADLLANAGVDSAAILTAANPFSRTLSDDANSKRNSVMEAEAKAMGIGLRPAVGQNEDGTWVEPSFLLVGASLDQACHLADRHQQNAFVWLQADGMVSLVLRR